MQGIILVAVIAITVEMLVDYVKKIAQMLLAKDIGGGLIQLATVALAVGLCFVGGADLFSALGIELLWKPLGVILTGIFSSRGVKYVSGFIRRLQDRQNGKQPEKSEDGAQRG